MKKYSVTGMSCAACVSRVEKAVKELGDGLEVSVNLLTNSMTVEGEVSSAAVISAVEKAGYKAEISGEKNRSCEKEDTSAKETAVLKKRFISSLAFLIVLMYLSMGGMIGLPMPYYFSFNPLALGILQLILSGIIMVINQRFFINGFKGLVNKSPNMDSLVSIGSAASFVYSVAVLISASGFALKGNTEHASHLIHQLYFESAAMILVLVTLGKMLESYSKGKTTNAIKSLMAISPKTATLLIDGKEKQVPIEQIKAGDIFIVKSGQSVPVDGVVIKGNGSVDESALTGESMPVDKAEKDNVLSATVLLYGYIECRALRVGEDTTLSKIIKMVSDASSSKAPIAKIADRVSGVFVPIVIAISVIATVIWLILDKGIGFALARGVSVLVISCPCALGLATPVAIMVGNGVGAKNGLLFKNAAALENLGKIKTVVLDKTGTVTKGVPEVTDVILSEGVSEEKLTETALGLERKSEHPLAGAIVKWGKDKPYLEAENFKVIPGGGVMGKINGDNVYGGNARFAGDVADLPDDILKRAEELSKSGKTPMFFVREGKLLGIIAVADVIKEDSASAVNELKSMGLKVVMLTGDNKDTAEFIGKNICCDEIIADVLPDGKAEAIKRIRSESKTAMVGDGINDAVALTEADIGIAIGNGADIACESADIVLVKNSLSDVVKAIKISRATLKNIKENLFWAFLYNTLGIPLAAGVFIPFLGWELNPMFAAAAMSLSSFCVVSNALRLNFVNLGKEVKKMTVTLKIEGMMCPHCEKRVKDAIDNLDCVISSTVDHKSGTAKVTVKGENAERVIINAIEAQGYKVIGE